MKIGEKKIIAQKRNGDLVETWDVFLCLLRLNRGFSISVKRYQDPHKITNYIEADENGNYENVSQSIIGDLVDGGSCNGYHIFDV